MSNGKFHCSSLLTCVLVFFYADFQIAKGFRSDDFEVIGCGFQASLFAFFYNLCVIFLFGMTQISVSEDEMGNLQFCFINSISITRCNACKGVSQAYFALNIVVN